jgi:CRP/FNR family transcriptional regulator
MVFKRPLISKEEEKTEYPSRLIHLSHGLVSFEKFGFIQKIPKNSIFIEAGDIPKYCYVIKKGCVVGFEYTPNGDERIYDVMLPQTILMEINLFFNIPSPIYFKSLKSTELICIERQTLLNEMAEDQQVVMEIIQSISYKFLASAEQTREINCHNTSWRFCNLLLMFAEIYGVPYEKKIIIEEKLSQQLLSNLLYVNRLTVNRIIKKLKDMGLIEQINGYYCICNKENLKKHMGYLEI